MLIIRNISAGVVIVDDLGITLAIGEDFNLGASESPDGIDASTDLRTRITASEIVALDPLDGVTELSTVDSIAMVDRSNAPNFRIFGGDLNQLTDVDTTGVGDGDILEYNLANSQFEAVSPAGGAPHDLDSHTDVTITSVLDNHTLKFDSGTGQWVNILGVPVPGAGGAIVSQLFWGPIPSVVGTTIIPRDVTLPLITEGTELWSQSMTLNETTSTVRIATNCTTSSSSASIEFIFAVFRDSLCIGTAVNATSNKDSGFAVSFEMYDEPGVDGPVTYSVRVGKSGGGGTWSINEVGGVALYAGTMANNSFSIEEINVVL